MGGVEYLLLMRQMQLRKNGRCRLSLVKASHAVYIYISRNPKDNKNVFPFPTLLKSVAWKVFTFSQK